MKGIFRVSTKTETRGCMPSKRRTFRGMNDEVLVCRGVAESCPLERTIDGYTRPAECRRWELADASHCNFRRCLPTRLGHASGIRLDTYNRVIYLHYNLHSIGGRAFIYVIAFVTNVFEIAEEAGVCRHSFDRVNANNWKECIHEGSVFIFEKFCFTIGHHITNSS